MNAIERFTESLKRLFARSARTSEEPAEAPTADLTPPAAPVPPSFEAAPTEVIPSPVTETVVQPAAEAAPPPVVSEMPEPAAAESTQAEMLEPPVADDSVAPETVEITAPASVVVPEVSEKAAPSAAGQLLLRVQTERAPAPTFEVSKSGATLGRGEGNTIRLEDLSVSRKHARISYRQGGYWLSDVGSVSGTWVDGTKLSAPRRIATGQIIDIGVCRLTVESAGEDAASSENGAPKRSELAAQGRRRR